MLGIGYLVLVPGQENKAKTEAKKVKGTGYQP